MAKVIIESVRKNFLTDQSVVILRDEAGRRYLLLWISNMEGLTIALGLTGITSPRPLPVHFLANVLKATGVHLEEVRIEALKDNIFARLCTFLGGKEIKLPLL